ncbi:UDP-N-acetylmuramoyl-L-alanyl-D-glutamate--2,6-diaminopimelate ligase [Pseudogracilibacillus sp. ICA-222130]|uniref:UDP-N-acetylmuramoyl-L-alanyl-D-glutamate--2, 6-diaminopimelate ligase n=1 Tax=Pseudogracilibacillus sp. ICA-222130 TaxID=3134655 RepID=UPI0030BDAF8F
MKLQELLSILPVYQVDQSIEKIEVTGLESDHRLLKEGNIFVCIKGFTVDGHKFAEEAVEKGAKVIIAQQPLHITGAIVVLVPDTSRALALLASKYYDFASTKFPLIGITGTNGKTTTTYIIEKIYEAYEKKIGLIGTIQMKIGEQTFPIKNTTPDALTLQKTFHQMEKANVAAAVMEVSSHALDLGRVYGADFDVALFTNLSQDHLDYHKDMDDYLRAKTLLFTGLGNGYGNHAKIAILNADDEASKTIAKSTAQPLMTYGIENDADVMATNITYELTKTTFELTTPIGNVTVESRLIGAFNVYNILGAVAVAISQHIPLDVIKEALQSIRGVDGRFEPVIAGQDFGVIVDYAHTDDSLRNVLDTINAFKQRKVYVVVGCGGDRDKTKRPLMAQVAVQHSDVAILTSDNPRTEDPNAILADMTKGLHASNYEVIVNRKEAIERAIQLAEKDDIILIAGKGHETYQEIHGIRHDFDDRVIAKNAIEQRG